VNQHDPDIYVRGYDGIIAQYMRWFSSFMLAPFESNTILFFAMEKSSGVVVLIDYKCSLVNTKLRLIECTEECLRKFGRHWRKINLVFNILSAVSLFIVAIFYACIRELRINIIGKLVLLLAISEAFKMIANSLDFGTVPSFFYQFFVYSSTLWFLAMVYETFVLLKYYNFLNTVLYQIMLTPIMLTVFINI
jgi:hypothetical protein